MKLAMLLALSTWFFTTAAIGQEPSPPYSAQRIVERVQTLADGTRITRTPQKFNEYRDSAGRTRTEQLSASDTEAERITSINITDPVAGFRYVLDPEARTARQVSLTKREAKATAPVLDSLSSFVVGTVSELETEQKSGPKFKAGCDRPECCVAVKPARPTTDGSIPLIQQAAEKTTPNPQPRVGTRRHASKCDRT